MSEWREVRREGEAQRRGGGGAGRGGPGPPTSNLARPRVSPERRERRERISATGEEHVGEHGRARWLHRRRRPIRGGHAQIAISALRAHGSLDGEPLDE